MVLCVLNFILFQFYVLDKKKRIQSYHVLYERRFTNFETLLNPSFLSSIAFQKHEIYTYLSKIYVIHIFVSFVRIVKWVELK